MSEKTKIHCIVFINHLLALAGLCLYDFWVYFPLFISGWVLFGKLGGEAGYHRYFAHNSFETSKFFRLSLMVLGSLNGIGSPLSWLSVHRTHHALSDRNGDPHGCMSGWRVWFTFWTRVKVKPKLVINELRDHELQWFHLNYFRIIFFIYIVFFVFSPPTLFFLVCLPSVVTFHSAGLVNTVCHRWGYRRHETSDHSYNNLFVNCFTLGSGLHNNHHRFPKNSYCSEAWYELDIVGLCIYYLLAKRGSCVESHQNK